MKMMKPKDHPFYRSWFKLGYPYPYLSRESACYKAWQKNARNELGKAMKEGKIKPIHQSDLMCVDCGKSATCWEHRDYTKPLDVEPCCQSCNSKRGAGYAHSYFPEPTLMDLGRARMNEATGRYKHLRLRTKPKGKAA